MCPNPYQIEHTALVRLALLEAYRNGGLRDVEKRARDIIAKRCAEPVIDELVTELDALYERATPVAKAGRIDLYTDHPTVVDAFPNASERCAFCLLAYLTSGGTDIAPKENPIKIFNDEFRRSSGKDGTLRPDSRLGRMSDAAYAREKTRATEAGELWIDNRIMHPSQIALAALARYGTQIPDVLHWSHDDDVDGTRRYADILSRDSLVRRDERGRVIAVNHAMDEGLVKCFWSYRENFELDVAHFRVAAGGLFDATATKPYILPKPDVFHPGIDPSHVPGFVETRMGGMTWYVHDDYIIWLASLDTWDDVACGVLNKAVVDSLI